MVGVLRKEGGQCRGGLVDRMSYWDKWSWFVLSGDPLFGFVSYSCKKLYASPIPLGSPRPVSFIMPVPCACLWTSINTEVRCHCPNLCIFVIACNLFDTLPPLQKRGVSCKIKGENKFKIGGPSNRAYTYNAFGRTTVFAKSLSLISSNLSPLPSFVSVLWRFFAIWYVTNGAWNVFLPVVLGANNFTRGSVGNGAPSLWCCL